jgi:hypothetical protein
VFDQLQFNEWVEKCPEGLSYPQVYDYVMDDIREGEYVPEEVLSAG